MKKNVAIIGSSLCSGVVPRLPSAQCPTPIPQRSEPSETQLHRLLVNQVLVTMLEANTRVLVEQGVWPGKADKLVGALHHRATELYDRFYQHTSTHDADWLNTVTNLSETAVFSVVGLGLQHDEANTAPMYQLLTELARLAGVMIEDSPAADAA